jgi:hypothetical protein
MRLIMHSDVTEIASKWTIRFIISSNIRGITSKWTIRLIMHCDVRRTARKFTIILIICYGVGSRPALYITKRVHSTRNCKWWSWSVACPWLFFLSTTKTGHHDIVKMLLKVPLKHQRSKSSKIIILKRFVNIQKIDYYINTMLRCKKNCQ